MMLYMDPPRHGRYRRLASGGLTARAVGHVESYLRTSVTSIVDRVIEDGSCDFVRDIANEISLEALGQLIGLPRGDRHMLAGLGDRISLAGASSDATLDAITAAVELYGYFGELVQSPRSGGEDDLIAKLAVAEVDGERLSRTELDMFLLLLTIAGQETTRHSMSVGLAALIQRPDQVALLRSKPELLTSAVEEILRWTSPTQYFRRTATADTVIGDTAICAGDKVVLWYVSANRDERVFQDPDSFIVTRSPNNHVAFGGGGPHFCLGAILGRMELRVMLEEVLMRMPDISLDGQPEILASNFLRGLKKMPVRFTPGVRRARAS
jgi:cholest-4-en-3-one 26-monooxygenase